MGGYDALIVRHRFEYDRIAFLGVGEAEYGGDVAAAIAVVGRRPHRHQLPVEHVLDALVHQLMRPTYQIQLVDLHEVVGDARAKQPAGAARTVRPRLDRVLGVGPDQVAEGALVRDLLVAVDHADLVERSDVGAEAAVHAQHVFVDQLQRRENFEGAMRKGSGVRGQESAMTQGPGVSHSDHGPL